jgi:5-formyltetrahydrofolate cyclo-ligase
MVVPLPTLEEPPTVMHDMGKTALRRQFRQKRDTYVAGISRSELAIAFSRAPTPLKALFGPNTVVAGYVPIGSEADPRSLLADAEAAGCTLALPHVTSVAAPMRFLRWSIDAPLADGPFGLKQPESDTATAVPDVVLVPLVAFDGRLTRLGQGAGHYDRALSMLPDAVAIGVAWSIQEAEELPADPWDIPLHAIITEKAWIER